MTSSSSQTRVTASSGRMSRRDAYDALQAIQATARTFPGHQQAQAISDRAYAMRALTDAPDPSDRPAKADVLALQTELNVLVTDRLYRSERAMPSAFPATVVVLYGSAANDTARAFQIASRALDVPEAHLRLVDVSPVQTDRLSGARWTIRTLLPHEAR